MAKTASRMMVSVINWRPVRQTMLLGLGLFMLGMPAAQAAELDEPTALAMMGDLVIARPAGVLVTALGTAAFVVSLPFSALGGNVGEAAEHLVVGPAKATFVRCLGCTNVGRQAKVEE